MSFYCYWAYERYLSDCRAQAENRRKKLRQKTREERRAREARRMHAITGALLLALALSVLVWAMSPWALSA